MVTRKTLIARIHSLIDDLETKGYSPFRIVLFGSYAYGKPNDHSDIDLAIWDKKFTGCGAIDIEPIASVLSKYSLVELHTFGEEDTAENNPFAKEIMKKGKIFNRQ